MNKKRSAAGSESAIFLLVAAVIAMPILAVVLLMQDNADDKDWGLFFAVMSVLVWIPIVFNMLFA